MDPAGIPGDEDGGTQVGDANVDRDLGPDAAPTDLGPLDQGPDDPDLGDSGPIDLGPPDLGPPDLGPPDLGPPDLGPPDLGPPDLGPPDLGPPDMGCGMPEVCNGMDDDCDGNIDEDPGAPRGDNACSTCTRAVSPGGRTYQICPVDVTWSTALSNCRMYGYELASPETMAEDTFLDMNLIAGDDYWLALNDRDNEGTFEWEDGAGDRPLGAFSDWDTGEPNGDGSLTNNQDCGRINSGTRRWRDSYCSGTLQPSHYYICEAP